MALAPRFTPGGLQISLNAYGDNRSNNSAVKQPGQRITAENAKDYLHWLPEHGVIVCSIHKYAIRNVATHLRDLHSGTKKQRQAIVNAFSTCILRDPKDVESSLPLGLPLRILGKPLLTFICKEPECEQISISRDEMCKHCNRTHDWRSTKEEREHWHSV
jgi:hypothetical protein